MYIVNPRHIKKHYTDSISTNNLCCVRYVNRFAFESVAYTTTSHLFVVILEGEKRFQVEGQDISIQQNHAFFVSKGHYIGSECMPQGGVYRSLVYFLSDDFIKSFFNKYKEHFSVQAAKFINYGIIEIDPFIRNTVESTLLCFDRKDDLQDSFIRIKLEELLLLLMQSPEGHLFISNILNSATQSKIDLKEFMGAHYTKPLYIEDFAELSGRSVSSFKKDFKNEFNMPPKKWINKKRIENAMLMLAQTGKSITDIAFDTGFENASYFSFIFKQETGLSPRDFRMSKS